MIVKCIQNKLDNLSDTYKNNYRLDENHEFSEIIIGELYTVYFIIIGWDGSVNYEIFLNGSSFKLYPDELFEIIDPTPSQYWIFVRGNLNNSAFIPYTFDNEEFRNELWISDKTILKSMLALKELMNNETNERLKIIQNKDNLVKEDRKFLTMVKKILKQNEVNFEQYEIDYNIDHIIIEDIYYTSKTEITFFYKHDVIKMFSYFFSVNGETKNNNDSILTGLEDSILYAEKLAMQKIIENFN